MDKISQFTEYLSKNLDNYQTNMTESLVYEGKVYQFKDGQFLESIGAEIRQPMNGFMYEADMIAETDKGKFPLRLLFIPPVLDGNYLLATKIGEDTISWYGEKLYWTCYNFANAFYEYIEENTNG